MRRQALGIYEKRLPYFSRQRVRRGPERMADARPDITAHAIDEQRPHPDQRFARHTDGFLPADRPDEKSRRSRRLPS